MIRVTKISGVEYYINQDLIEYIEQTHGTILCLTTGKRLNVLESPEEVIERIVEFRRRLTAAGPELLALPEDAEQIR